MPTRTLVGTPRAAPPVNAGRPRSFTRRPGIFSTRRCTAAGVTVWLALTMVPSLRAQESPILVAMQEELQRAMAGLRMKDEAPPYYIAYRVSDTWTGSVIARLGALLNDTSSRGRSLQVEVLVGDYAFDSSRFIDRLAGPSFGAGSSSLSLDDDISVMRRQIWLATDTAYKRAVSTFSKKKAAFQNRSDSEPIPDFSRETPVVTILPSTVRSIDTRPWTDAVRKISAACAAPPDIQASEAAFNFTVGTRYFLNSEGFKVVAPIHGVSLSVTAETQADDGMMLRDAFTMYGKSAADFPPVSDLVERARALAADLMALRTAPLGDDYAGPVLVEGQGASELLAQTFVPLFLSQRAPDSDSPQGMGTPQTTPFLTRIGLRVLPDSLSVSDTPSLTRHDNVTIPGAYVVDDEGVKAKDVTLVEQGRLVTLLTSRTPQKNLLQSTGHGRGGSAQAGVLTLQSSRGIPASEMKTKYVDLLKAQGKAFGYIVRGIAAATPTAFFDSSDAMSMSRGGGPRIVSAIKVTPDGKEELVRGLRVGTVTHSAYRDLVEASAERTLYSYRAGGAVVSLIVPNLIFEELDIQRAKDVQRKPPTVPSPLKK